MLAGFLLLAGAVLGSLEPAHAAEGATSSTTLWIEVLDDRGRAVERLAPGDLDLQVDGTSLPVGTIAPIDLAATPWRHVLYFDAFLSDRATLRAAADALAGQAEALAALGTVEIVLADPEPRWMLPPTRDPAVVAQVLARLALETSGRDEIGRIRRELLVDIDAPARVVAEAAQQERALRQTQLDRMVAWLADTATNAANDSAAANGGSENPRALWLAAGALALPLDPFYQALGTGRDESAGFEQGPPSTETARYLAAVGWTLFPLAVRTDPESAAGTSEFDRWREQAGAVERSDTVDLLGLLRRRRTQRERMPDDEQGTEDGDSTDAADRAALEILALTPSTTVLGELATPTGGETLLSSEALAQATSHLAQRLRLNVVADAASQELDLSPSRPGGLRRVDLAWTPQAAAGASRGTVRATAWIGNGTPDELGAVRARRLLDLGLAEGSLGVLASVDLPSTAAASTTGLGGTVLAGTVLAGTVLARLDSRLDLTTFPSDQRRAMTASHLRLTVLSESVEGTRRSQSILVPGQDLSDGDIWQHSLPLELPVDVERVAVVLEILSAGASAIPRHGSEFATINFRSGDSSDTADTTAADTTEDTAKDTAADDAAFDPLAPETATPADSIRRTSDGRFLDSVDVRLAELYVTVTGKSGEPVRGLTRDEFVLRQGGVEQPIDSVVDATDLPITLGLAIDSSSSMFYKLPAVASAARSLVRGLQPERDRAFLVAFGPRTRLVESATTELSRVESALRRLEADGGTPLWEAVLLSVEQLAGQKGKKALVVFLDGADDDGNSRYRESLDAARAAGVPIYLIVMNNEAARTEGKDFRTRSFTSRLDRLAAAGGGRVYYLAVDADLEPVYRQIENELRSYYLLTYYPSRASAEAGEGGTGGIDVKVSRDGLSVRTLAGYGPS